MISRHIRLQIKFSLRTSVKLRSQLHHWCIKVYIKKKLTKNRKQNKVQVCLVHLLNDTIFISISPKIKLRIIPHLLVCLQGKYRKTNANEKINGLLNVYNTLAII